MNPENKGPFAKMVFDRVIDYLLDFGMEIFDMLRGLAALLVMAMVFAWLFM